MLTKLCLCTGLWDTRLAFTTFVEIKGGSSLLPSKLVSMRVKNTLDVYRAKLSAKKYYPEQPLSQWQLNGGRFGSPRYIMRVF